MSPDADSDSGAKGETTVHRIGSKGRYAATVLAAMWFASGCSAHVVGPVVFGETLEEWRARLATREGVASWVRSGLDESANPCTDFFEFACGKRKGTPPMTDRNALDFARIQSNVEIWFALAQARGDDTAAQRTRDFATSCIDVANQVRRTPSETLEFLGLPRSIDDDVALMRALGILHRHGMPALFVPLLVPEGAPARVLLALHPGGLGIEPSAYTSDDPLMTVVRNFYRNSLQVLDSGSELRGMHVDEGDRVVALEAALARAMVADHLAYADPAITVADLERQTGLPWRPYFDALGATSADRLQLTTPAYFQTLGRELLRLTAAERTAYVQSRALRSTPRFTRGERYAWWQVCTSTAQDALGAPLWKDMEGAERSKARMSQAEALWSQVHSAAGERIGAAAWLGEQRAILAARTKAIVPLLGYPVQLGWTPTFPLSSRDFLANFLAARAAWWDHSLASLGSAPVVEDLGPRPAATAAGYLPRLNSVVVPAEVLAPPLFGTELPAEMNYAGLGFLIGHEIGHSIDRFARAIDSSGGRTSLDPALTSSLKRQEECLADHFRRFDAVPNFYSHVIAGHVEAAPIDAELTMGEGWADVFGARAALGAYRAAGRTEPPLLDGMSGDAAFFVVLAQNWCGEPNRYVQQYIAATDVHTPPRARINAALSALPEFAEAFDCPVGAPMRAAGSCDLF